MQEDSASAGLPAAPEDPDAAVVRLRRQIDHLRRWLRWELWKLEPRSFAPPDESPEFEGADLDEPPAGAGKSGRAPS